MKRDFILFFLALVFYAANSSQAVAARNNNKESLKVTRSVQKGVKGMILDENGQPVPGATIMEKGTKNGVLADSNGNFSITITDNNAVLVITSIGYDTQEIVIGDQGTITVRLKENSLSLNDVVVVGYGTQKRGDVTGAISSINEKTLREVPVTNPQQLLQGRIAGALVTQNSNKPGASPSVLLRGNRSITASNNPLYVIDGIPTTDGLNDVNPNDIVSMDVLKDASATAIYGSRGANGVIIITTARGKESKDGKPDVNYNAYVGTTRISKYIDVLSGSDYVEFRRDANRSLAPPNNYNDNDPAGSDAKIFNSTELAAIAAGQYTDWQREVTQNGSQQNHQLSILGGAKKTRYNISLGYYNDKGYIKLQDFSRYNLRVNLDQDIGSRIKMGISMLGSYTERNGDNFNPIGAAVEMNPIGSPYDENGNLIPQPNGDAAMYNPLSNYIPGNLINLEKRTRILSSIYAQAEIIDGLKFRINFGPDLINTRTGNFTASNTTALKNENLPTASTSNGYTFNYTLENILTYDKKLGKHSLNFTGLYSIQQRVNESGSASVIDLPIASVTYNNLGSANEISGVGSGYSRLDILSYMGRVNYGFDSRFLFTLTMRADGSSVFAPGHKWGFFPSAAFAYNMINESYLKNISYISNLKLRLSYGRTGNTAVGSYQTLANLGGTNYDFGGVPAYGFYPNSLPNSTLKWETTEAFNLGLDFGFLNDRITGSFETYRSRTFDLLLPFNLPNSTGFGSVITNIGSTRNTGFETTISSRNIVNQDNGFQWSTDITAAYNKEAILELSAGKVDDIGNARFIGKPIHVYYDYQKTGIWQIGQDAEAKQYSSSVGQIKVADRNGNGKIDADDRTIIGNQTPDWNFGINNRFSYKNFDLGVFMVGITGRTLASTYYTAPGHNSIAFGGRYNIVNVDYWTPDNPTDAYPQPKAGTSGNPGVLYGSTLKFFDGSYLRIRNIDLGYTLPKTWVSKIKAQSVRIYFDMTNPYTFSSYVHKYNGTNPDISDAPSTINYLLGLNVRF